MQKMKLVTESGEFDVEAGRLEGYLSADLFEFLEESVKEGAVTYPVPPSQAFYWRPLDIYSKSVVLPFGDVKFELRLQDGEWQDIFTITGKVIYHDNLMGVQEVSDIFPTCYKPSLEVVGKMTLVIPLRVNYQRSKL